ncbi:hypothetical protein [Polyangium sp. y55x31]|uniref:hypothetical protein n=1 Tax=Polyangium sp. y55x31 TaxID=3042688 RepID=UPI0024831F81|nr:hypothetical protein [Polyangium sp. y55x31]MDI1476286.1 hypothetical protein [Polyangium sp. y55x31]
MRKLVVVMALLAVAGCNSNKGEEAAAKPAGSGAPAAKGAAEAPKGEAKGELVDVELTPMPLKIKVRSGGMGAMDMSLDDQHKSATVDIGDGASLNVSEAKDDFAALKKGFEGDTVLFPFKKWAKEGPNMAIVQFENAGKTGYIGFMLKEIGGKKYVCKTTGMDGVPSAEVAEKNLKPCETLAAK